MKFNAAFAALLLVLGQTSTIALADHAADLAKCNAIQDTAKRHACLALISPAGQPAPDGKPQAQTPNATCAFLTDIHQMADCLATSRATQSPSDQAVTDYAYLKGLLECGTMPPGSTQRAQCLKTLGWPKDTSWVPPDTYDTVYRATVKTCVAGGSFADSETCGLEAFLEAIVRRIQRAYQARQSAE